MTVFPPFDINSVLRRSFVSVVSFVSQTFTIQPKRFRVCDVVYAALYLDTV